jgi:hypothetical protein
MSNALLHATGEPTVEDEFERAPFAFGKQSGSNARSACERKAWGGARLGERNPRIK